MLTTSRVLYEHVPTPIYPTSYALLTFGLGYAGSKVFSLTHQPLMGATILIFNTLARRGIQNNFATLVLNDVATLFFCGQLNIPLSRSLPLLSLRAVPDLFYKKAEQRFIRWVDGFDRKSAVRVFFKGVTVRETLNYLIYTFTTTYFCYYLCVPSRDSLQLALIAAVDIIALNCFTGLMEVVRTSGTRYDNLIKKRIIPALIEANTVLICHILGLNLLETFSVFGIRIMSSTFYFSFLKPQRDH